MRPDTSGHHLNTGSRVELTGASGHTAEAHNGSFFSRCYKYSTPSCEGVLVLIPIAEKHVCECKEEQGPSEVLVI